MPPAPSSATHEQKPRPSRWHHNPWIIFAVALALRLALIFNLPLYRYPTQPHFHFQFGWEMGRVARAIASGHGFASPFYGHTGPTAWVAPIYPYLMAGVFRLLGIYSVASAIVLMLLNALIGALTIFPIRTIASRCFSRNVALASMWVWAAWPFTMKYVAHLRDTSLTMLLFTCIIALTIRMRGIGEPSGSQSAGNPTLRAWLLLGFLWGIIALTDPTMLLVLPAGFLWILAGSWSKANPARFRRQFLHAILAGLLCIACAVPWTVRNALVFHKFIPLRSDFGAELYLGNGPGSTGELMIWKHPYDSPQQYHLYRSMGEIAYCHMRGDAAMAFIRRHPGHFLADSLRRVFYFWFGLPHPAYSNFFLYLPGIELAFTSLCGLLGLLLAFRNRIPGVGLIASAFALYPLTYYFVVVDPRFLYQIAPLLYILTLYLWTSAEEGYRVRIFMPSWWRARFASPA